jgi:predicted  nucleic acid-binding Zn-ribbon protein
MLRMKNLLLVAVLALTYPGIAAAQQRPAPAPTAAQQQEVQQLLAELRQLNDKLEAIRAKALEDPKLLSAQNALGEEIKTAMEKADPELPRSLQRVEVLEAEAMKAQQAGDNAKLQQLAAEAQTIQRRFVEAQAKVMSQDAIASKVDAFQGSVEARMTQIDPQAPAMIKRFHELETRLSARLNGMAGNR